MGRSGPLPVFYGSTSGRSGNALLSMVPRATSAPLTPPSPGLRVPPRDTRAEPEVRGEAFSRDCRRAAAAFSFPSSPPRSRARASRRRRRADVTTASTSARRGTPAAVSSPGEAARGLGEGGVATTTRGPGRAQGEGGGPGGGEASLRRAGGGRGGGRAPGGVGGSDRARCGPPRGPPQAARGMRPGLACSRRSSRSPRGAAEGRVARMGALRRCRVVPPPRGTEAERRASAVGPS